MREEHRVITTLFADLVGSTPLTERLDEETAKLVVGEAIAAVVVEVERLGGHVKDLAGDGVLAFFGAPTSHEDDAERAARAALNILQAIDAYGSSVALAWGADGLAARVGVSTGPVALGPLGAGGHVEYAAFGETVITAARLQSVADPGTALVDFSTQRIIESLFEFSESQELTLKGKSQPVRAFGLRAALSRQSRRGTPARPLAALVGREAELATMQRALVDVGAGRGGIVSITGQAGVGKSRLLADSRDSAEPSAKSVPPILWLEGGCASYAEGIPYFPFQDLLGNWLGVTAEDPEVRVRISLRRALDELFGEASADVYPYLATLVGIGHNDSPIEGSAEGRAEPPAEELQQRTFAAVGRLFDRLAQDRPVVLVLEDLHWADGTSTRLTKSLLPVVEGAAVLLVMTQRDERDHGSWELKETAARDFPHLVHEINLDALAAEAERRLLYELVGSGTLTSELEQRVLEASEGNALFLEELVRSLVDVGALVRDGETGWRLDHEVDVVIPETVERVILARADRLNPHCRELLTAASVAGRQFAQSLLSDLVSPEVSLEATLHDLQRLGFVVQELRWPQSEYRFKHALIQEAIYRTMLSDQRTRLHRAAGESLERDARETQEDHLALARHWDAACVPERAIPHFRAGAALALRAYSNEEAAEALRRALELIGNEAASPERDAQELEVRIMLGVPLVALTYFGGTSVRENYERARDLCTRLGRPVSAPILRGLAIYSITHSEFRRAKECGIALLDAAQRGDDVILTVEANYVMGVTSFWVGEFADSRRNLEEAIARYSPEQHERHLSLYSQDPKVICLSRLSWTLWYLGYPEQAARMRDEAVKLGEELGQPFSLMYAISFGMLVSESLKDELSFTASLDALERLAAKERSRYYKAYAAVFKQWLRVRDSRHELGPLQVALRELEDESLQTLWASYLLSLMARAQILVGDPVSSLESVTTALEVTRRTGGLYMESELERLRGEILIAADRDASEIKNAFRSARDIARRQQAKSAELRALVSLTRWQVAHSSADERDTGLRELRAVYEWFTEGHDTPDLKAARRLLVDSA